MKTQNSRLVAGVAGLSLFLSLTAGADEPRPQPRDGRPQPPFQRRDGFQPQGQPQGRMMDFARILNEEQRETFREAIQAHREEMRDLEEKIPRLRREIEESILAEKLDEKAIREKTREIAEAETERTLIRARAMAKIRASLSPEQVEQLKEMFAQTGRMGRPDGPPFRGPGGPGGPGEFRDGPPRRPGEPQREGADLPPPRRPQPGPRNP